MGTTTLAVTTPLSDILLGSQANNFGTNSIIFGGTLGDIRDLAIRNVNSGAVLPSFTGLSNLRNLTVSFDNAAIAFPTVTVGGDFTATAGGSITETGAILVPFGTTTLALTSPGTDLLLGTQPNDFGTIPVVFEGTLSNIRDVALRDTSADASVPNFTGLTSLRNVTIIHDAASIAMTPVTLSGNLTLTANGNISETGAIIANSGTTTLTETLAGSDILLSTQANDFGASAIIFSGTQSNIRDFALRNINSHATTPILSGLTNLRNLTLSYDAAPIVVPTVTLTGDLTLTAYGNITQTGPIIAPSSARTYSVTLAIQIFY